MKLLLTVCLTCALLYTAESLRCHVCDNDACTNTTSVLCPDTSVLCITITSVRVRGSSVSEMVYKNCSTLLPCLTSIAIETEWSVNRGFTKEAFTQTCCLTDNCNLQTLATPNLSANGKQCPACASSADSLAGTCNTTVSCVGVENSCFNGTTTSNSTELLQLGCMSRNLCGIQAAVEALLGADTMVVCGAPWSVRISAMLLTCALTAHRVLV